MKRILLLLFLCVSVFALTCSGCTMMKLVGQEIRATTDPVMAQMKADIAEANDEAINASAIADDIRDGKDVTQERKEALADYNEALASVLTSIKMGFNSIDRALKLLPAPPPAE